MYLIKAVLLMSVQQSSYISENIDIFSIELTLKQSNQKPFTGKIAY